MYYLNQSAAISNELIDAILNRLKLCTCPKSLALGSCPSQLHLGMVICAQAPHNAHLLLQLRAAESIKDVYTTTYWRHFLYLHQLLQ